MSTTRERPIIFGGEMVRAILGGQKTQTRRIVKPQPEDCIGLSELHRTYPASYPNHWAEAGASIVALKDGEAPSWRCPYGQPGDRLWVRETFADEAGGTRKFPGEHIYYRADGEGVDLQGGRWSPSIHMPRWASRILLEVNSVRVERLQDISDDDAMAEGVIPYKSGWTNGLLGPFSSPVLAFLDLWESINGPGSWDQSPWVWVVGFRRIEQ